MDFTYEMAIRLLSMGNGEFFTMRESFNKAQVINVGLYNLIVIGGYNMVTEYNCSQ